MSSTILPFLRPVSAGEVLDTGFRLFKVSLLRCLPLSLAAVVLGQLPTMIAISSGRAPSLSASMGAVELLAMLVASLATLALWRATILRQQAMARGQRTSLGADLGRPFAGMAFSLAVLLLGNLVLLLALGLAVAALGAPGLLRASSLSSPAALAAALVLAVPGAYLSVTSWFSWLSGVIDGKSVPEALRAGLRLVRGQWWRTVGILTVGTFAVLIFYTVGYMVGLVIVQLQGGGDVAAVGLAASVVTALVGALFMPFMCALSIAQYDDLKLRAEGVDLARRIELLPGR